MPVQDVHACVCKQLTHALHEGCHVAWSGASEPRNLGYMERLGLWGEGTPSFAAFQDFLDAVGGRGVGALELVAMDMKARGMFVCRTLSFQGGNHPLATCS